MKTMSDFDRACDAFDNLSKALYFGPAFRALLMSDPRILKLACDLSEEVKKDKRLSELTAK